MSRQGDEYRGGNILTDKPHGIICQRKLRTTDVECVDFTGIIDINKSRSITRSSGRSGKDPALRQQR